MNVQEVVLLPSIHAKRYVALATTLAGTNVMMETLSPMTVVMQTAKLNGVGSAREDPLKAQMFVLGSLDHTSSVPMSTRTTLCSLSTSTNPSQSDPSGTNLTLTSSSKDPTLLTLSTGPYKVTVETFRLAAEPQTT